MIDFVSVNGLAGGNELGHIQSGFHLVHRTGSLDLGAVLLENNRKMFGWDWDSNHSTRFESRDVDYIASCPPCSAWSTLTSKHLRGGDALVLKYTNEVFEYAAKMRKAPEIITIESVQQAFSTGREYYQGRREWLEEQTGKKYDLIWLYQSNQALGGATLRKRVFVVFSQRKFGVEYAQPVRIARFGDAIRDLEGLSLTSHKQPYRRPATWWSTSRRASDGVDGHFNGKNNHWYAELMDMAADIEQPWLPNEPLQAVLKRVYERTQRLPYEWERNVDKLRAKNWTLGINQTTCWDPDKQGKVVTGTGPTMSVHYSEHRLLTHRECFRMQGWPDTVRLWPVRDNKKIALWPGKGVPVDAGRWLGEWVKASFEDHPGTIQGEVIGDRERKVDITHSWRHTAEYEAPWRFSKNTLHEQREVENDHLSV